MKLNVARAAISAAVLVAISVFQPVTHARANGNIANGPDGYTRMLWRDWSGQADVWEVNTSLGIANSAAYGPYDGWTARAIAVDGGNQTHILWTNWNGAADVWILSANLSLVTDAEYPQVSDWTARDIAADGNGNSYLLWTKTDGSAAIWKLGPQLELETDNTWPPVSSYTARAISWDSSGNGRLMWNNWGGGGALVYLLNTNLGLIAQSTLSSGGQVCTAVSSGPGGQTFVLWSMGAGPTIDVLNSSLNQINSQSYTPVGDSWSVNGITVNSGGGCTLSFTGWSTKAELYSIASNLTQTSSQAYGPFTGWSICTLPYKALQ